MTANELKRAWTSANERKTTMWGQPQTNASANKCKTTAWGQLQTNTSADCSKNQKGCTRASRDEREPVGMTGGKRERGPAYTNQGPMLEILILFSDYMLIF